MGNILSTYTHKHWITTMFQLLHEDELLIISKYINAAICKNDECNKIFILDYEYDENIWKKDHIFQPYNVAHICCICDQIVCENCYDQTNNQCKKC